MDQTIIVDGTTEELATINNPLEWQLLGRSYTATGYGSKIPTSKMVNYLGKNRRIYCTIYSNSGTCWIIVDGKKVIVR